MMKRMKKTSALLLALTLLALPALTLASQVDLGQLWLSLPASCDVFTRKMAPDDPVLALYGLSAQQVAQELSSHGLMMRAREISGAYTITLSAKADSGPDFSALSDQELLSLELASEGEAIVMRSRQAGFLAFRGRSGMSLYSRVAGTLYRLTLRAEGRLTGSMENTIKQVAQSMDFGLGQ